MRLLLVLLFVAPMAHAARFPAAQFGLTPETGYTEGVTKDEPNCDQATNVLVIDEGSGPELITKCDGSLIGWVTRHVSAVELGIDDMSADEYDMTVKTGIADRWGNDAINIYTCGTDREDLLDFPEVAPATNPILTYEGMMGLREQGKNLTVQLFFNEFVYSGKCIGAFAEKI